MTPSVNVRIGFTAATLWIAGLGLACDAPPAGRSEPAVVAPAAEANPALPGFDSVDEALRSRLEAALRDKGPDYVPRTEHKGPDGGPEFTNRLIEESSPYLLQHAHNPVSWYSWSPEAFERAKRENKSIFLSVGR